MIRARIRSDEDVVTNASIELLGADAEWHDVRHAVRAATVTLEVGDASRAHLDLILVGVDVDAAIVEVDRAQLEHTATVLRFFGYTVEPPAGQPQHVSIDPAGETSEAPELGT